MKRIKDYARGKLGNTVHYVRDGQQIARTYVDGSCIKDAKSEAQMMHRAKWGNIAAVFRSFGGALKESFENKSPGQNDYNCFMGINLVQPGVYLTKQQRQMGGGVAAPYFISRGSLPSIEVTDGVTDIAVGDWVMNDTTTVADFAEAVVINNSRYFAYGDQLSCFVVEQLVDAAMGVPRVVSDNRKVVLDPADKTPLRSVIGDHPGFAVSDGKLALGGSIEGAYAWVHSRKRNNKLYVSTQLLVCTNPLYEEYTQTETRLAASRSYGMKEVDIFLEPSKNLADGSGTGSGTGNGSTGGGTTGGGSTGGSGGSTGGSGEDGDNPIG